jgi:hypothetical protein
MVLASARLRGIHPPDNIQNDGCPGGECLSNAHWLGPWRQHFDDESWRGRVTRVDLAGGVSFVNENVSGLQKCLKAQFSLLIDGF